MKHWALILLIITGITSCHKDAAIPEESLYLKWQITQIQYRTGDPVTVSPVSPWAIVTFKSNGMILYGDDGKYYACCSPARFKLRGSTLDLVDVASVPLPERTPNGICATASCTPPENAWSIETLSNDKLIIRQAYAVITYEPYL